jgi:hypothetical protein
MPRKATGSVSLRNGVWYARITLGPKERPPFALPTCTTAEQAEARCAVLSALAAKLRADNQMEFAKQLLEKAATHDGRALEDVVTAVDRLCTERTIRTGALSGALTFQGFAEKWTNGELRATWPDHIKEKRSVSDDVYRLKRLYEWIGNVALTKFTLDDAERAMRQLPDGLSLASRRQYAQLMHRVLSMAVFPARIITTNPLPRGFLPSGKSKKALTYLYPPEDAQLLSAPADKVPLCFRLHYGFLAREGMRTSEAAGLRWNDITWTDDGVAAVNLDENKKTTPVRGPFPWASQWLWRRGVHLRRPATTTTTSFATSMSAPSIRSGSPRSSGTTSRLLVSNVSNSTRPPPTVGRSGPMTCVPPSSPSPLPLAVPRPG